MKYWYKEIWWNGELMNLKVDQIKLCYNYQLINLSLIENDKLTRRDKNLGIDELASRRVDETAGRHFIRVWRFWSKKSDDRDLKKVFNNGIISSMPSTL